MNRYDLETRWRLVLGAAGAEGLGSGSGAGSMPGADGTATGEGDLDGALSWLYDRAAEGEEQRSLANEGAKGRGTGPGHTLEVPEWINAIHNLFPKEAIERLERDAFQRYGIVEVVTRLDALQSAAPSLALTEAILRCKNRMDERVLEAAREIVKRVVDEMKRKLLDDVEHWLGATPWRHRRSRFRTARNLDAARTIRRNLKNWDRTRKQLVIDAPQFFARVRRAGEKWQVIVLVDQSGSMARNVIHASVVASVLWHLPALSTHLVVYDTEVVDLTQHVEDPVEILFRAQLGGGTDGAKALRYAADLVDVPHRTLLVWITDFEDDGEALAREVTAMVGAGVQVFGAASLDASVRGAYDRGVAQRVADAGAHVAATTPAELTAWVAEKLRR